MSNKSGPDERSTVENDILWWVRPYETSFIFRDQIKMKAVQEDVLYGPRLGM